MLLCDFINYRILVFKELEITRISNDFFSLKYYL